MILPGDIPYIIIVVFFVIYGFKSGLFMQLATFVGLTIAAFIGPYIFEYLTKHHQIEKSHISFLIIVLTIYMIFYLIGKVITLVVRSGGREVDIVFSLAGAGVGLLKGLVVCVLFTHMIAGSYLYNHSRISGYFSKINPAYFGTAYRRIYKEFSAEQKES